jgi:hypothetical protein
LRLIIIGRCSDATVTQFVDLQFNGDTGSNYEEWYLTEAAGSTPAETHITLTTRMRIGQLVAANGVANSPGVIIVDIPGYTGTVF